jgi:hypothetical protein
MPMGPAPLGFAYFVGVKFAGYTAAAAIIRKFYPDFHGRTVSVGLARTGIGLAAGALYGLFWYTVVTRFWGQQADNVFFYLAALLPLRIAEWLGLVYLFFDRSWLDAQRAFRVAAAGTGWSYFLDAIGIGAALVIPGGIWVC